MSDYPMLISNKLHSFRNFLAQISITEDRYSLLQGVIPSTDTGFGSCLNIDDNGVHIFYVWKIIVFITKSQY